MPFAGSRTELPRLNTFTQNKWTIVLALGAGLLLAASFPPLNVPALAWFAPGLILYAAQRESGKKVFFAGFISGLGHYLASLYWLTRIPFLWKGLAAYGALTVVLALFIATWCWICWKMWRGFVGNWTRADLWRLLAWPLLCAAAWVTMEMAIARVWTGFPWNFLGVSQYRCLPLIQIASVAGIYSVSFLVVWVSISALVAVLLPFYRHFPLLPVLGQLALPLSALAGVMLFGHHRISTKPPRMAELKVALVQPSIPQRLIWDSRERTNRFSKLLELSRAALATQPDLLVWPETAMPELIARNGYTQNAMIELLRNSPTTWMAIGAADTRARRNSSKPGAVDRFNSAFLINPRGDLKTFYNKRHLVPFGEYMPGTRRFPKLAQLRSSVDITPGDRDVQFDMDTPRARFAVSICFEDVFPHEIRRRVTTDTDFILNLANNGWFGESAAQWQHATSALFRAIENGVPLVRCANNGLTCWIDQFGRMHEVYFPKGNNIYQSGFKVARIPLRCAGQGRTLYNRYGDWFGWGCAGITSIAFLSIMLVARTKPYAM